LGLASSLLDWLTSDEGSALKAVMTALQRKKRQEAAAARQQSKVWSDTVQRPASQLPTVAGRQACALGFCRSTIASWLQGTQVALYWQTNPHASSNRQRMVIVRGESC
jgi:hypothetical protein